MLFMLIIQDQLFGYYRHPQASACDSIPDLLTPFYHNLIRIDQPLPMPPPSLQPLITTILPSASER